MRTLLLIACLVAPLVAQDRFEAQRRESERRHEEFRARMQRDREDRARQADLDARFARRSERPPPAPDVTPRPASTWQPSALPGTFQIAATAPDRGPAVEITPVKIEPAPPAPDRPWGDALTHGALAGLVLGGALFLIGGAVLGRELTSLESAQALLLSGVAAVLTALSMLVQTPAPRPGLTLVDCADGRFTIGMPEARVRSQTMAMMMPVQQYVFACPDGAYLAGWFDVPAWAAQQSVAVALENACNGALKQMDGAAEERRTPIRLGALAGMEVEGTLGAQAGRFRFRAYFTGRKFYLLTATGVPRWVAAPEARRFLDSFVLKS